MSPTTSRGWRPPGPQIPLTVPERPAPHAGQRRPSHQKRRCARGLLASRCPRRRSGRRRRAPPRAGPVCPECSVRCNLVTGCFGDVITDLFWRRAQGPTLGPGPTRHRFLPGGRTSARGRPPPWGRTSAAGVGCTWVQVTEESCTLASSRKLKRATTVQYGPGAMGGEEPTRPFDLRPLCVPLLKSAQQTLVDQTFAFPSHVTCLLPLLSPRPQPSSSLAEDG